MLQTLEQVQRLAPEVSPSMVVSGGAGAAEASLAGPLPAPAVGPIVAYWPCSAANNPPSNLNPRVIELGHRADKAVFLQHLSPAVCDEVMYHLPCGAIAGREMPFHSAELARQRGHKVVIDSTRSVLKETAQKMGRLPWVYIGYMRAHYWWTNPWAAYDWSDLVWECTAPYRDEQDRPLCKIAVDVAGVLDHRSLEWQARCLLRRWGFPTGYEPRPALGTPWAEEGEDVGWTTNALMRVTSDAGDGRGSGWAVPLDRVRGQQMVLSITNDWSIDEHAGYLARGLGLGVAGQAFNLGRPDQIRRTVDRARELQGSAGGRAVPVEASALAGVAS